MSLSSTPAVAGTFTMDVKVYTSMSGELKAIEYDGVSLIVETPQGSLMLQNVHTVPIAIIANGEWHGIEITKYETVKPDPRLHPTRAAFATNEHHVVQ